MVRITDPERSRAFYEALGFRFSSEMDIVREGVLEATNYFFSIADQTNVLELTFNHDGRTYELGTGCGHIAVGVDDLDATLSRLNEEGIEPEREPYEGRHHAASERARLLRMRRRCVSSFAGSTTRCSRAATGPVPCCRSSKRSNLRTNSVRLSGARRPATARSRARTELPGGTLSELLVTD
jgi:lactoylglutathione lyase